MFTSFKLIKEKNTASFCGSFLVAINAAAVKGNLNELTCSLRGADYLVDQLLVVHFSRNVYKEKRQISCFEALNTWPLIVFKLKEAFQGIETISDRAPKTGDNPLPKHRQPPKIGRKSGTIYGGDNLLLNPLCFLCGSDICP